MNHEQIALVALLRTRPDGLSWPKLTEEVLEYGSAAAVWERHNPDQLRRINLPPSLFKSAPHGLGG